MIRLRPWLLLLVYPLLYSCAPMTNFEQNSSYCVYLYDNVSKESLSLNYCYVELEDCESTLASLIEEKYGAYQVKEGKYWGGVWQRFSVPDSNYESELAYGQCGLVKSTTRPKNRPDLSRRTFSSIALLSPSVITDVTTADRRSENAKESYERGSEAGLVGGAAAGAACGPYWGVCVGYFSIMGSLAGGVAGAMHGFYDISEEDLHELEEKLRFLDRYQDFQAILMRSVKALVPTGMLSEPERAEIQAVI
jgi:hypothetical protein